jgi:hypothetical protein
VEICSDTVSQDEVNVVITLRDLHESMNEAKEQGRYGKLYGNMK